MKISLNTIKGLNEHYKTTGDIAAGGVDELVQKIGAQLGGVDEVIDLGAKYQGIIVAKVVSCDKHPDADKLSLCKIDDGGVAKDVARDDQGRVQVVCGAPNARVGLTVAWLPPGTTVPQTYDKDPFVLEARQIRGQVSNGMLASPRELGLGDSHEGILELPDDLPAGADFAQKLGLDDTIIDIENKMFTHRPDCFGFLGVARELAGIQGMAFKSPDWYVTKPKFPSVEAPELPLEIVNELPELVRRFTAIVMSNVQVGPSPLWLQTYLAEMGQKSINNIVDYTNFYMLETGQPLHAYDYDKLKNLSDGQPTIVVRYPHSGEKIKLLNGKEIEPRPEAIMIATDKTLIGIGGIMGGSETEVDNNTTSIVLECANFDMYSVRRTSMAHGLFTDASTRFTKGQSPLQNLAVLVKIVDEIRGHTGGKVAGALLDNNHVEASALERDSLHPAVTLSADFINTRLGLNLDINEIKTLLENVEFKTEINHDELTVVPPFWRTDIELREDVVEEVGRLYGYDKLPLTLPKRDLTPAIKDVMLALKAKIRAQLAKAGANEVLTYSFVHSDLLSKVGQDAGKAFKVANALSPDLQYYRLSLLPSLLDKVHANIKAGYDQFALFELGKAHILDEMDPQEPQVPKEVNALGFVYAAKSGDQAAYYVAKNYLEVLMKRFAIDDLKLEVLQGADLYNNGWIEQMTAPFEQSRSAVLRDDQGLIWGVVGEFKQSVRRSLKLPVASAGFEIDPLVFNLKGRGSQNYVSLSRFPEVIQDISLKVPADLAYQELFDFVRQKIEQFKPQNSFATLNPIDIYQKQPDSKNVSFRLKIASYDRTLTDPEINKLFDEVAAASQSQLGVTRL